MIHMKCQVLFSLKTLMKKKNRMLILIFSKNINKLEMCQYDADAPAQGPSSAAHRHFAKNEVEKGP